jgi:hypothetical protein
VLLPLNHPWVPHLRIVEDHLVSAEEVNARAHWCDVRRGFAYCYLMGQSGRIESVNGVVPSEEVAVQLLPRPDAPSEVHGAAVRMAYRAYQMSRSIPARFRRIENRKRTQLINALRKAMRRAEYLAARDGHPRPRWKWGRLPAIVVPF